jgi:hypothetical protein
VVQADAGVPERVPELLGEPVDVAAAVVQQHQVQVGPRRQLAAAQRPDGDERGLIGQADRRSVRGQPEVVKVDQRRAQRSRVQPAPPARLGEQHRLRLEEVLR